MTSLVSLFALFLLCLCQSHALTAEGSPWTENSKAVAFLPRGGGIGRRGRKGKQVTAADTPASDTPPATVPDAEEDGGDESLSSEEAGGEDDNDEEPFDLQKVNQELLKEEVEEIKKSQQLLLKQRRRRELDKTWLDKGITGFIEFFENIFSWKVIDV
eukprot:CAMPEP_0183710208 /NCGR_PEP_ID=MMETSP0737-20130205/6007_1 /TAXON_ID=385413 /ORGANISM="Thalassiosira miniscula, Strain CCMP1093" /LENGTH=157 /DNA_ID=CAMNT_0025938435 /DNA_START=13 /DNA_END=486 /DNA_ORIENTATION=-